MSREPPWLPRKPPSSWGVSRAFFEGVTLSSLLAMIALGLVFWALGERKRRAGLLGIVITAETLAGNETQSQ